MKIKVILALVGVFSFLRLFVDIQPAYAIPISPDKYYFDVSVGTEIQDELLIMGREELSEETTLYITPVGMKKVGEEHDRNFYIPDENDLSEPANWITVETPQIQISPGMEVYVTWSMSPTEYLGCGTSLAALMVSDAPLDVDENNIVSLRKQIVSQIHLNVIQNGHGNCLDINANLDLLEFKIDKRYPIFNYDQVPFLTRIENTGTLIARNPRGFVEIFGFGDKVTIPFNEDGLDIYPETIRKFENEWVDGDYPHTGTFSEKLLYELGHLRIGRYEARLGITSNVERPIVTSIYFWVFPWRVLLVVGGVLMLGFLIRSAKSRRKSMDR